jgi:hypothetical protein
MSIAAVVLLKCALYAAAFGAGMLAAVTWLQREAIRPSAAERAARRRKLNFDSLPQIESARRTLCTLAEDMAGQVHAHAAAVEAVSDDLNPVCTSADNEDQPLKDAAVKTVAANKKLQRRLEDAERQIRSHIGELSVQRV